jgi:hypothetical protein
LSSNVEKSNLAAGDRVSHYHFGEGVIEEIIDSNIVKIRFDAVGMKMLSLAFAKLTRLG